MSEAIDEVQSAAGASAEWYEHYELLEAEEQRDEPSAARGVSVPQWIVQRMVPTERLLNVTRINGVSLEEAEDRPSPRKRNNAERSAPDRAISLATGNADTTGRMLDFGGTLGAGSVGIIYGPHASGLTRTLESVVAGACANATDMVVIVLLLRARSEEVTEWRRRFKNGGCRGLSLHRVRGRAGSHPARGRSRQWPVRSGRPNWDGMFCWRWTR